MQFTKWGSTNSRRRWRRGLLETEKTCKKSPKNGNKFLPKPKTEIKALTGNASVGIRISLLFMVSSKQFSALSKTKILMDRYYHSLSVDTTIMVSKTAQSRWYYFLDTIGYHSNTMTDKNTLNLSFKLLYFKNGTVKLVREISRWKACTTTKHSLDEQTDKRRGYCLQKLHWITG